MAAGSLLEVDPAPSVDPIATNTTAFETRQVPVLFSTPRYTNKPLNRLTREESSDSSSLAKETEKDPPGPEEEDLQLPRMSVSTPTSQKISFNFHDGSYDCDTAFRILAGGTGGITPSSSSSSIKTLSFHSAKELEDYIEGRSSSETDEAQPGQQAEFASLPGTPRNSSESSKSGTIKSLRSMWGSTWKKSGTVSFSKPGELGADPILHQGQLSWESSTSRGKWKARLWVLSGNTLGYYRRGGTVLRTNTPRFVPVIDLREVLEVFHDNVCFLMDECCFGVDTGTQKHYFKTASKAEMATWMVSIARQRKKLGEYV